MPWWFRNYSFIDRLAGYPGTRSRSDTSWRNLAIIGVAGLMVPVLVVAILAAKLLSLPSAGDLPIARAAVDSRITRVFDASGFELTSFHRFETSIPVARHDIPDALKQAVVASEDKRFYEHKGVDSRGIVRALWNDLRGGELQGASTITQQYVRMVYADDERTVGRKVREAVLARRVDNELSKDEILYRYLSRAYLGGGAYGVGAAAESYFHKSVRDLTISEAAMLAGVLPSPSNYDPRVNLAEAEARRRTVLDKMAEQGRISGSERAAAGAQRLALASAARPSGTAAAGQAAAPSTTVVYPAQAPASRYPAFADYVRRYLIARFGDKVVYEGGLQVQTSLDPATQGEAEAAVGKALKDTRSPLDMAMTVVDARTGLVKAMVGGRDPKSQVNLALGNCVLPPNAPALQDGEGPVCIAGGGSGRQPGSSFKPFTLAKAFEEGMDERVIYQGPPIYSIPGCSGVGCTVKNVESGGFGRITLRQATAESVNTVFAQLIEDVGVKDTAELAHRLGLTTINPLGTLPSGERYGPSLTLGAAEVAPLDMAGAYAVFAARGIQRATSPVVKVTDNHGKVLEDNTSRAGHRVLAPEVADRVNDVLKDVVGYGTGKGADIGRPAGTAGKTGTSENFSDAWFVGYTPQLVTSVWMGFADAQKPLVNIKGLSQVFGGTLPAQAWRDFMTAALARTPAEDFVAPPPPAPTSDPTRTYPAPPTDVAPDPYSGLPPGEPSAVSITPVPDYLPYDPPAGGNSPPTAGPTPTPCLLCLLTPHS